MKGNGVDAARAWHGLDRALAALHEARIGYGEAGREDLVECLAELLEKTELGREQAKGEVAENITGGPGRST